MSFSQASITALKITPDHGEVYLSWVSSATAGTPFQVYQDGRLAWCGTQRSVHLPTPFHPARYDVGTVAAGEERTDFSGSLASVPAPKRAVLTWLGGTYEADDIAGFHVYGEATPGGGVNLTTPLATVPAYPGGQITDGWGCGGWGIGSWGHDASSYTWTSKPLAGGTWNYTIKAFDQAGNESTGSNVAVVIAAPPNPPAAVNGKRLVKAYSANTHKITLTWAASP